MNSSVPNRMLAIATVALVATLAWTARRGHSPSVTSGESPESPPDPTGTTKQFVRRATDAPVAIPAPEWSWSSIESEDYRKYVANLRSIGCPEQTVRDIILADLNKLYAAKEAPFKDPAPTATAPWDFTATSATTSSSRTGNAASRKEAYERRKKLREVELEKAAVVKELLGYTLPLPPLRGWTTRNYDRYETALNALPPEKRERTRELLEQFWAASDTITDTFGTKRPPEYFEQLKRANEQRRESMLGVLGPDELDDFEMRASTTAQRLSTQLAGLNLSEEEFKAIYKARAEVEDPIGANIPLAQIAAADPSILTQKTTEAEALLKNTLGEERYAKYEKSQDPNWQTLDKLKSRFELPEESIEKAYELQKQLTDVAQQEAKVQELRSSVLQQFSSAERTGDDTKIRTAMDLIAAEQSKWTENEKHFSEERQRVLNEITSVLGPKPGLLFSTRVASTPPVRNIQRVLPQPNVAPVFEIRGAQELQFRPTP